MTPEADESTPATGSVRARWWIQVGIIVACWTVVALLEVAEEAFDSDVERGGLRPGQALQIALQYAVWALLTPGIYWLSRRFLLDTGRRTLHLTLHIVFAIVIASSVDLLDDFVRSALVTGHQGEVSLRSSLYGLGFGDELLLYFVVLVVCFARGYFLSNLKRQEEASELRAQAAHLQAHLAEARFQGLRMQLNPHFLFNTLHTISSYLERDPKGARRMIARLSELLRYVLDLGDAKEVPLRQEIAFIDDYLDIQSIRFQDSLTVEVRVDPGLDDAMVPALILQPLVENAITHGASRVDGEAELEVRARRVGERLHLSVRDNGPGLASSSREGVGLGNTRDRLRSLYGTAQSLELEPNDEAGITTRVILPYRTESDISAG